MVAQRSEKTRRYIEETGLPFNILVDDDREVIKAYGVWHRIGLDAWDISRPALFLIDQAGVVRYVYVAGWQHEFATQEEIRGQVLKCCIPRGLAPLPGARPRET